jgi:hypothetical protein
VARQAFGGRHFLARHMLTSAPTAVVSLTVFEQINWRQQGRIQQVIPL